MTGRAIAGRPIVVRYQPNSSIGPFFVLGGQSGATRDCESMNQRQYEESRRHWSKARPKRTMIDGLKMAAVVGSFLMGLVGTIIVVINIILNASEIRRIDH